VKAILSEISGKKHNGSSAVPVPTLFGMNFQAVSVGEKLVENEITGGYKDALGTPSKSLLKEIEFVDKQIGRMINTLKEIGLYESTLVAITAMHGRKQASQIAPHSRIEDECRHFQPCGAFL
jgi:hypothetical protein